ncbi:NAD(P)-binding protein [Polychaeton citri CBS 116435]|uniref:NAD(P)-binding protein n=1 Tax=Polychaeton citri CBS 116435 TaxID=1314669 RepID=A0A9P4Q3L4_9PEZI|nr:NAD(P)-binding protein [Polychaeton citri CBS 116435]
MPDILGMLHGKWNPPQDTKPSFEGHSIIITGANTGVGLEAAIKFVQLGASKVILGVRTPSKGEEAARQIEARTGRSGVTEVWSLDILDYESIKAFASKAEKQLAHLEIACLNAGVVMAAHKDSRYGWEQTLQVNVLSTTLLALLLLPKLKASKTASHTPVLEIVGSSSHYSLKTLKSESAPLSAYNDPTPFDVERQYQISKLFVTHANFPIAELAKDKDTGRPDTFVVTICPGGTKSDLARDMTAWYFRAASKVLTLVQRETEEGARTYISGVSQGETAHGKFWMDDSVKEWAPLVDGEKGKQLRITVWNEILDALEKDIPEIRKLAS